LLYILYGEDDFSRDEALAEIKEGLGDPSALATNTSVLEGRDITLDQLAATCDTMPFLGPARLVIVRGLLGLFEPPEKGKRPPRPKDTGWPSLKDHVAHMPESTMLVLLDAKLKKTNPLLKALAPAATSREFPALKGSNLTSWIHLRAKKCGGAVSPSAARMLAELTGSNLRVLSNEIDKLCLYALGRTVEEDDIAAMVASAREPSVFVMVDALLEGQTTTATRLLHRLEDEGAAPPYLLFMITRQFRQVIQARDLLQGKARASEIGAALGIRGYALEKTIEQAKGHTMERLEEVYEKLLDTDLSIKTGRYKGSRGELALDLLVSGL
jgi:DNA polymerase-3 subunit delta